MKKYMEILGHCPLFAGVTEEELTALLECLQVRLYRGERGEAILSEGDQADAIGLLLSGRAHIEQVDFHGNRHIVTDVAAGELFGESFVCADLPLPVTVMADSGVEVMFLPKGGILGACPRGCGFHRRLVDNLVRLLAAKNVAFHQKLTVTAGRTTREKLLLYLDGQAKRAGSKEFVIPFDRQALADYLGVDRSGLSVQISALRREGVLKNHRNRFTLR